jgi:RNA polymerase sigma-54 factor
MKQGFSLSQSQHFSQNLSLTPSLQQAIKLLQLPTVELLEELQVQVRDNPFLQLDAPRQHASIAANGSLQTMFNPASALAYGMQSAPLPADQRAASIDEQSAHTTPDAIASLRRDELAMPDYGPRASKSFDASGDGDDYLAWLAAPPTTLRQHLHAQAGLIAPHRADAVTVGVLGLLIDSLQESGYFDEPLEALHASLAAHCEVPNDAVLHEAVAKALGLLHRFDPCGVGAFDVQHCLLLQLQHPNPPECVLDAKTSTHAAAIRMVRDAFECLAKRDRAGLKKRLTMDELLVERASALIRQLDPKPGLSIAPAATEYAVPDVLVRWHDGQWQAQLQAGVVPQLRLSHASAYAHLLKPAKNKALTDSANTDGNSIICNDPDSGRIKQPDTDVEPMLHTQLQQAKQLVRTVEQHFATVLRVAQAIVAVQQDFFSWGAKKIKPMVLRDIAERVGLHESTVSRVTTKKYLQSSQGVFELKYFFSSKLTQDLVQNTYNQAETSISSTALKAHLLTLIQGEPPHKPLSDQALTDALNADGHALARRTVAKYREQLGYPSAHARKPF